MSFREALRGYKGVVPLALHSVRLLGGRLASAGGVIFAVLLATFVIFQLVPRLSGVDLAFYYTGRASSPAQAAAVAAKFGFDRPVVEQFGTFVGGIVTGREFTDGATTVQCSAPCVGYSFRQNRPVTEMITEAFPVTLGITVGAAVLWLVLGVLIGTLAAIRRGTWIDRVGTSVALLGVSFPEFFTGMVLIYLLTSGPSWLRLYPTGINYTPWSADPVGWFVNLIPVWCCLAFLYASIYTRLTRAGMIEILAEDYVITARAKGLGGRAVVMRHGLRAMAPQLATIAGVDIATLLGGALLIETVFSFPGMGRLAYTAISSQDLPVIMGVTLVTAGAIVIANLIIDLAYRLLDPRISHVR